MKPYRIALVGLGKIARDQHLSAIAASDQFVLVATIDPVSEATDGVPHFKTLAEFLASGFKVDCAAICTPPQFREALARAALGARCHLLLEKPPVTRGEEAAALAEIAHGAGRRVFAAWHSRFAPGVAAAAQVLRQRPPTGVHIRWHENVRKWHPGQDWIFESGGLGVFDPAINALSILTELLPANYTVSRADLVRPAGRAMPARGTAFLTADELSGGVTLDLDFLSAEGERWDIQFALADGGNLLLETGGAGLVVDGMRQPLPSSREYPAVYARFAELLDRGCDDFDIAPLIIAKQIVDYAPILEGAPLHWS